MRPMRALVEDLKTATQVCEAREASIPYQKFFKGNKNRGGAFASGAFGSTKEAFNWMSKLEKLGATDIVITNVYDEAWRIKEEGGAYADAVFFDVPEDKKDAVLKFVKSEKPDELDEVRTGTWRVWWD